MAQQSVLYLTYIPQLSDTINKNQQIQKNHHIKTYTNKYHNNKKIQINSNRIYKQSDRQTYNQQNKQNIDISNIQLFRYVDKLSSQIYDSQYENIAKLNQNISTINRKNNKYNESNAKNKNKYNINGRNWGKLNRQIYIDHSNKQYNDKQVYDNKQSATTQRYNTHNNLLNNQKTQRISTPIQINYPLQNQPLKQQKQQILSQRQIFQQNKQCMHKQRMHTIKQTIKLVNSYQRYDILQVLLCIYQLQQLSTQLFVYKYSHHEFIDKQKQVQYLFDKIDYYISNSANKNNDNNYINNSNHINKNNDSIDNKIINNSNNSNDNKIINNITIQTQTETNILSNLSPDQIYQSHKKSISTDKQSSNNRIDQYQAKLLQIVQAVYKLKQTIEDLDNSTTIKLQQSSSQYIQPYVNTDRNPNIHIQQYDDDDKGNKIKFSKINPSPNQFCLQIIQQQITPIRQHKYIKQNIQKWKQQLQVLLSTIKNNTISQYIHNNSINSMQNKQHNQVIKQIKPFDIYIVPQKSIYVQQQIDQQTNNDCRQGIEYMQQIVQMKKIVSQIYIMFKETYKFMLQLLFANNTFLSNNINAYHRSKQKILKLQKLSKNVYKKYIHIHHNQQESIENIKCILIVQNLYKFIQQCMHGTHQVRILWKNIMNNKNNNQ